MRNSRRWRPQWRPRRRPRVRGRPDDGRRSLSAVERVRWENARAVLIGVLVAVVVVLMLIAMVVAITRGGEGEFSVELLFPAVGWYG